MSENNSLGTCPKNGVHLWQQKRPIVRPLAEIAAQYKDRNAAIIAAYKTGAYSQREIGVFYQLHPTTIGTIVRKFKSS